MDVLVEKFGLAGKTALVTGATRGIGAAMAIALAEAGADIVSVQRDDSNQHTLSQIRSLGRSASIVSADLNDRSSVAKIIPDLVTAGVEIHILVTCAGIQRRYDAEVFPISAWDDVLQVNLTTVFTLCRDFGSYLLSKPSPPAGQLRGTIINIASLLMFQGGIRVPAYAAAKGGVGQLTKALSNEWAGKGIKVNSIAPGYIQTDLTEGLLKDQKRQKAILERIPVGRWGTPEDLKWPVVFLASDASNYMSGESLTVDGGWMGW